MIPVIEKPFKIEKKSILRTIKDDYESLLLHMFHQYGRAMAFISSFDPKNFVSLLNEYKDKMFENPKYKIFSENLQFAGAL